MNGPTVRERADGSARWTWKSPRSTVRGTITCSMASAACASPRSGSLPGKKLMAKSSFQWPTIKQMWPRGRDSSPKLPACQGRSLCKDLELGPRDHRVDAAAEAAIGRRNDVFPADILGEAHDTLGDEFGM